MPSVIRHGPRSARLGVLCVWCAAIYGLCLLQKPVSAELFQVAEVVIPGEDACAAPSQKWSNVFPETTQGPPPNNNNLVDVVIEANKHIVLDESVWVGTVYVFGCLVVDCDEDLDKLLVHAHGIHVQAGGYVSVGTEDEACARRVDIDIYEAGEIRALQQSFLGLYGQSTTSWTQLAETAMPGDTSIKVESASKWAVGDQIVIATTDWNRKPDSPDQELSKKKLQKYENHREMRTISGVNKKANTVSFDEPLEWKHYGELQYVPQWDAAPKILDERAEVALLTRSIRVRGVDCLTATDGRTLCATTRFLKYSVVQLSFVEFTMMGHELFPIGNYPVHFHKFGDADGLDPEFSGPWPSYVIGCAIWKSVSRGIVLHGVTRMTVKKNVVFDIAREGYFLEDGYEEFNMLTENLAIDCGHAAFWIVNMNNHLMDNRVGGSQGPGFDWNPEDGLVDDPKHPYPGTSREVYSFYGGGSTFGRFERNTAHGCKKFGFRQWRKVAVAVNCYCTPLPKGVDANTFYGRSQVEQCPDDECKKNAVFNDKLDPDKKIRQGYAVYRDLTLYHNGWITTDGEEYNPNAHMFPGLLVADQCVFIRTTSLDGMGPQVFSDVTYVRQSQNVIDYVSDSFYGSNCNKMGLKTGKVFPVEGPRVFNFGEHYGSRASAGRGCFFDRIVMLGAPANNIGTGRCGHGRIYVDNEGMGPFAYLSEKDVPELTTPNDFAPFPLLATAIEEEGTGFLSAKQVKYPSRRQVYLPSLDFDWLEPLQDLDYTYKAWSELPGWNLLVKQTLPYKFNKGKLKLGNPPSGISLQLNNVKQYKGSDGMFTFMIKWPALDGGKDVVQIWKQENDPTKGCYAGFTRDIVRTIAGSDKFPTDVMHWGTGLGKCSDDCLLSKGGELGSTEFCVGLTKASDSDGIPILVSYEEDKGAIPPGHLYAQSVEFYALKDGAQARLDDMTGFTKVFEHRVGRWMPYEYLNDPSDRYYETFEQAMHQDAEESSSMTGNPYWSKFSVLDQLEQFRGEDGLLEFKILYDNLVTPAIGNKFGEVEWFRQDTNPLDVLPGGCPETFEGIHGALATHKSFCGLGRNANFESLLSFNSNNTKSGNYGQIGQTMRKMPTFLSCIRYLDVDLSVLADNDLTDGCRTSVELYVRSPAASDQCSACLDGYSSCAEKCALLHGKEGTCSGNGGSVATCCECFEAQGKYAVSSIQSEELPDNLIQNGSFEDDSVSNEKNGPSVLPSSWSSSGDVEVVGKVMDNKNLAPYQGDNVALLGPGAQIWQEVETEAGHTYKVVVHVRREKSSTAVLKAYLGGKTFFSLDLGSKSDRYYQHHVSTFVAEGASTVVKFKNASPSQAGVLLDWIQLIEMEVVPVYEFYSSAKKDHAYSTQPGVPSTYSSQGHAFNLYKDGDFQGSVPLYATVRVKEDGNPMAGLNADMRVSVAATQGKSSQPEYLTTDLLGYCYKQETGMVATMPLGAYERENGVDGALVSSTSLPDALTMKGSSYEKSDIVCHTPAGDAVVIPPSDDPTPGDPGGFSPSPSGDEGPASDTEDEDSYDPLNDGLDTDACDFSTLGYACAVTLSMFPKVTLHWTLGGKANYPGEYLGVGQLQIEIAMEAEAEGMVAFALASAFGSMASSSAVVGWSSEGESTVGVYELESKPLPSLEGDALPFTELDAEDTLVSYSVGEDTVDGKTVTTLIFRLDLASSSLENSLFPYDVMYINWAVSSEDKLAFHDMGMGFEMITFANGGPPTGVVDPSCTEGVLSASSEYCCPSSCSACEACAADDGPASCCSNAIPIDQFCTEYAPPCALDLTSFPDESDLAVHPSDVPISVAGYSSIEKPVVINEWGAAYLDGPKSLTTPLGGIVFAFESGGSGPVFLKVLAKCPSGDENSWFMSVPYSDDPVKVSFPTTTVFEWYSIPLPVALDVQQADVVLVELGGREPQCKLNSVMLMTVGASDNTWECSGDFIAELGDVCSGCNILCGSDAKDTIYAADETCECIFAGAGDDYIVAGTTDTVYGNDGDDYIACDALADEATGCVLYGEKGQDVLLGGGAPSTMYGGLGHDVLYSNSGAAGSYMVPGFGNDVIYGSLFDVFELDKGQNSLYLQAESCEDVPSALKSDTANVYLFDNYAQECLDAPGSPTETTQFDGLCEELCPCPSCNVIVADNVLVSGTEACDCIVGNDMDNIIYGLGADDVILGMGGNGACEASCSVGILWVR